MQSTSHNYERGFTIIETMIYLAIAGVLFLITLVYLGDKQRNTQFTQGVREFESTLNDIANDTSTGVFPSINDVVCSISPLSGQIVFAKVPDANIDAKNPVRPGDNNDCIFVGRVVQLTNDETDKNSENYFVHTLVGQNLEKSNDSGVVSNFEDSQPTVVYDSNIDFDGTVEYAIPWGVSVNKVLVKNADEVADGVADGVGSTTEINGLAYLYSNFGQSLNAGTQNTGVANIALFVNENDDALTLDEFRNDISYNGVDTLKLEPLGSRIVYVCIKDVDGKSAMIEIGGKSGSFLANASFNPILECST